jgi:cytochrome P450
MPETSLPPGPRMPRAVQTLGWVTRPMPFMERCQQRYGDIFTLRIAQEGTWVFLAHPDLVKQVFKGDPRLLHAGEGNAILGPLVGHKSVLLLDEAQHMAQRKLLLPPFHGERMQRYGELMAEAAERELASWPTDTPLTVWPRMQAVTLEVIIRAVFGVQDAGRVKALSAAIDALSRALITPLAMATASVLGPARVDRLGLLRRALAPVDRLLFEEIEARRHADDLEEREDILSLLLLARHENGEPMSDQELRDELMTLLVAGHETTATSLAWALERLVRHPEKLERLRDEVREGGDEYMDAVSRETLRLRPVLPIVVRRLQEPMEFGGHLLPEGTAVAPCIHLIHRRPEIYPEPRAFRPERFLEAPAGTYSWIPFGGGVRRCIGASFALFEMKQILATVVGRLDLRASRPGSEHVSRRGITLTPGRGAEIVVEPLRSREPVTAAAAA